MEDANDAAAGGRAGDDVAGVDAGEAFDDLLAGRGGCGFIEATEGVDGEAAELGILLSGREEAEEPVGAGQEMERTAEAYAAIGFLHRPDVAVVADDVADGAFGEIVSSVVVGEGDRSLEEMRGSGEHVGRVDVAHLALAGSDERDLDGVPYRVAFKGRHNLGLDELDVFGEALFAIRYSLFGVRLPEASQLHELPRRQGKG